MLPSAAAPNRKKENDLKSLYLLKEKKKERNVSLLYIYLRQNGLVYIPTGATVLLR